MDTMTPVRPAAPVASWLGGKSKLAKTLIARIKRIPHSTYIEPFVGLGGVFLRRTWKPRLEVMNDRNGEIINLFRILQRHYPQPWPMPRRADMPGRQHDRRDLELLSNLVSKRSSWGGLILV